MRPLKFRAWDAPKKEWMNVHSVYGLLKEQQMVESDFGPRYAIEQFTGLQDKNGKDIYEGDILGGAPYGRPHKIVVEMIDWRWTARNFYIGSMDTPNEPFSEGMAAWEVIGNIHSNPELLERK